MYVLEDAQKTVWEEEGVSFEEQEVRRSCDWKITSVSGGGHGRKWVGRG